MDPAASSGFVSFAAGVAAGISASLSALAGIIFGASGFGTVIFSGGAGATASAGDDSTTGAGAGEVFGRFRQTIAPTMTPQAIMIAMTDNFIISSSISLRFRLKIFKLPPAARPRGDPRLQNHGNQRKQHHPDRVI